MAETRSLIQMLAFEARVDCVPFGADLNLNRELTDL